jgi:glucose/arabinose dehydrogenase
MKWTLLCLSLVLAIRWQSTVKGQDLQLEAVISSGLNEPLFLTSPPGDINRLFILERGGDIRVFDRQTGTLLPDPYISIPVRTTSGEQGLLGMAFDPGFAANGRFYVDYTRDGEGDDRGDIIIARYTVSGDPMTSNVANATAETVLTIDHSYPAAPNHNGGWIGFRPTDPGRLYIAIGDGGGENNNAPDNSAQNLNLPLGKMLRIDVSGPTGYTNPPDNLVGGLPEIYQYGLRNPWRNSFDRANGDLWIADVGQNAIEEINYQEAGSPAGQNFGWRAKEGTQITGLNGPGPFTGMTDPIYEYIHGVGESITGGYVYRGSAMPSMQGQYFFGDFTSGRTWTLRIEGGSVVGPTEWTDELSIGRYQLASFGEDAQGELYMLAFSRGAVYRIAEAVNEWDQANGSTWHTAGNWSLGQIPNSNTDVARLWTALTFDGAIDIATTNTTVKTLSFRNSSASYSITAGGGGRLTFAANSGNASIVFESPNSKDHSILADLSLASDIDISLGSGRTLTLGGQQNWGGRTATLHSGSIRYESNVGATNTAGASLVIYPGASVELGGTASATSDGITSINVTNDGTLIATNGPQGIGALTGAGSTIVDGATVLDVNYLQQATISLTAGSQLNTRTNGGTSVMKTLTIAGDAAPNATLDLNNNAAIVDYTASSPIDMVRQQILAGRGGAGLNATWNGPGINSSAAAEAEPLSHSIGYAENAALPLGSYAEFHGELVDGTAVLIAFTRTGDANLDGVVENDDVTIVGANFAPGSARGEWSLGDFDYSGFVDNDDVTLLGVFYNPTATPITAWQVMPSVPEPNSFILLVSCVVLIATLLTKYRALRKHVSHRVISCEFKRRH